MNSKVARTPSCVPHNMGSCCGGFEINSGYANSGYQLDVFCIFQRWYANSGYRPDCGCAKYAKVTKTGASRAGPALVSPQAHMGFHAGLIGVEKGYFLWSGG